MLERKRESAASKKQAKLYTENATVKYWLEGLGDSSKKQYLRYFPRIMDYVHTIEGLEDVTPDELIEMRKADLKSDDPKAILQEWFLSGIEARIDTLEIPIEEMLKEATS